MLSHHRVGDALELWRAGERLAGKPMAPEWAADYAAAIANALVHLQRHTTMPELVAAYFSLTDAGDWLDVLCRRPSGRLLNDGIVEDAAYWRRYRELLTSALVLP